MSNPLDVKQLADRYVAQWNEPDAAARSALIRELWAPDAVHVLVDPPQEIREAAAKLAVPAPPLEAHGHDGLNARMSSAYEMFIARGEHIFELAGEPFVLLPDVIGIRWSMRTTSEGASVGGGLDILSLDADGRVRTDHQFIERN